MTEEFVNYPVKCLNCEAVCVTSKLGQGEGLCCSCNAPLKDAPKVDLTMVPLPEAQLKVAVGKLLKFLRENTGKDSRSLLEIVVNGEHSDVVGKHLASLLSAVEDAYNTETCYGSAGCHGTAK